MQCHPPPEPSPPSLSLYFVSPRHADLLLPGEERLDVADGLHHDQPEDRPRAHADGQRRPLLAPPQRGL
eukprot:scaffold469237_cov33-Prasinocladus_malaysianus.AAC.1